MDWVIRSIQGARTSRAVRGFDRALRRPHGPVEGAELGALQHRGAVGAAEHLVAAVLGGGPGGQEGLLLLSLQGARLGAKAALRLPHTSYQRSGIKMLFCLSFSDIFANVLTMATRPATSRMVGALLVSGGLSLLAATRTGGDWRVPAS